MSAGAALRKGNSEDCYVPFLPPKGYQAIQERGEGEKAKSGAGRPSLGVKPTLVRLPVEAVERIEALVGKNQMAAFIREAVDRELKRRERQKPES